MTLSEDGEDTPAPSQGSDAIGESSVEANGIRLRVLQEGEGTPVVLLHGFPDSADLWRGTMRSLADAGFNAIAPDLRGFGGSDKPEAEDAYAVHNAVADLTGLLDALGIERAHLVGFDWGAPVAWLAASTAPHRLMRMVAVAVGHPAAFFSGGLEQYMRSWYVWLIQFRSVAEALFSRDDFFLLREWLRWLGYTGDEDAVVARMSEPGALTAALGWYRANIVPESLTLPEIDWPAVHVPVLGIRGARDHALAEVLMEGSGPFVKGEWRYERFEESGHWPMLDEAERFSQTVIDWLSG